MKTIKPIFLIITIFALCGCEKDISFTDEDPKGLVVNALASTDTTFMVSVSDAYSIGKNLHDNPWLDIDFAHYIRTADSAYYKQCVFAQAKVNAVVNGSQTITLRYDPKAYCYTSDYRPKIGDKIALKVEAEGRETVTAEATIPATQRIEMLEVEKYYSPYDRTMHYSDYDSDTLANVTLRLHDPAGEHNFYRLRVREHLKWYASAADEYMHASSDVFTSTDAIFRDENLISGYGGWSAMFSTVFDDTVFDGKSYTFDVTTRLLKPLSPADERSIVIELQSITPEYYYYVKSCQLYRVTPQDEFTEAIQIVSNCSNGLGIFGALGTEKHYVNLDK